MNETDEKVKVCCININCINNMPKNCCNLKNIAIDTESKCAGFVKVKLGKIKNAEFERTEQIK